MIKIDNLLRQTVKDFISEIFESLHTKNIMSITSIILGILDSKSIKISDIGRSIAELGGTSDSSGIAQVDRLLRNQKIDVNQLMLAWSSFLTKDLDEIRVNLDWTEFDSDNQSTLSASLQTDSNRSIPLLWKTIYSSDKKGNMNQIEDDMIYDLAKSIGKKNGKVVIVTDRGFNDTNFMRFLKNEMGYDFTIRLRSNIYVYTTKTEGAPVYGHISKNMRPKIIKDGFITKELFQIETIYIEEEKRKKDGSSFGCFCIVSTEEPDDSLFSYKRRFQCEETFRDIKDIRFGLGMNSTWIRQPERRDRLLLLGSIALFLSEKTVESTKDIGILNNNNNRPRRDGRLRFSTRSIGFRIYRLIEKVSQDQLELIAHRLRFHLFNLMEVTMKSFTKDNFAPAKLCTHA
jgi:hypothetical protein